MQHFQGQMWTCLCEPDLVEKHCNNCAVAKLPHHLPGVIEMVNQSFRRSQRRTLERANDNLSHAPPSRRVLMVPEQLNPAITPFAILLEDGHGQRLGAPRLPDQENWYAGLDGHQQHEEVLTQCLIQSNTFPEMHLGRYQFHALFEELHEMIRRRTVKPRGLCAETLQLGRLVGLDPLCSAQLLPGQRDRSSILLSFLCTQPSIICKSQR
mmetsp:Transcript_116058/g.266335  ORF Transcript_116058/g.266335 Transcript_116058/m.266335 type:complete len:210 (-) Transcript_116058:440-1069(-)